VTGGSVKLEPLNRCRRRHLILTLSSRAGVCHGPLGCGCLQASLLPARPRATDGRAGAVWPAEWPARTDKGYSTTHIHTTHHAHTHRHLRAAQWAR